MVVLGTCTLFGLFRIPANIIVRSSYNLNYTSARPILHFSPGHCAYSDSVRQCWALWICSAVPPPLLLTPSPLSPSLVPQARRHIHTFKPSQLCAVLLALASYPPDVGAPASTSGWHPGRLFLFDFISHSSPPSVMRAWTGDQASQVLWGLSRFRWDAGTAGTYALAIACGLMCCIRLTVCSSAALWHSLEVLLGVDCNLCGTLCMMLSSNALHVF